MVPAGEWIVLLLSLMLVGKKKLFGVFFFYFLIHIFYFLLLTVHGDSQELFFCCCCSWKHPVTADGGFRLWFWGGVGVEWCEGRKWTRALELFPLVYSHMVYRINREKRGKAERGMQFFYRLCLGEAKAFGGGFRCFAIATLKILLFVFRL